MQKLSSKQQWVYDYLCNKAGEYVSPSEIGKAYRRAKGTDRSWYSSSDYSSIGSEACRALFKKNHVLRNTKGRYQAILPSSHESSPAQANVSKDAFGVAGVAGTSGNSGSTNAPIRDPEEARRAYNAANGYVYVATMPNGTEIYKKQNEDGKTWSYFNQHGKVYDMIWNEATCTKAELVAIAKDCYQMGYDVIVTKAEGTGYKYDIGNLVFYMKDNLIHSAKVIDKSNEDGTNKYRTVHGTFDENACFVSKSALIAQM